MKTTEKRKRFPSVDKLSSVFEDPKAARSVFEMSRSQLLETPEGRAIARMCYHPPKTFIIRLGVLNSIDSGLFGVESLTNKSGDYASYLNTGDTYCPTVIYWRGNYRVQSVGDFVERVRGFL